MVWAHARMRMTMTAWVKRTKDQLRHEPSLNPVGRPFLLSIQLSCDCDQNQNRTPLYLSLPPSLMGAVGWHQPKKRHFSHQKSPLQSTVQSSFFLFCFASLTTQGGTDLGGCCGGNSLFGFLASAALGRRTSSYWWVWEKELSPSFLSF